MTCVSTSQVVKMYKMDISLTTSLLTTNGTFKHINICFRKMLLDIYRNIYANMWRNKRIPLKLT